MAINKFPRIEVILFAVILLYTFSKAVDTGKSYPCMTEMETNSGTKVRTRESEIP